MQNQGFTRAFRAFAWLLLCLGGTDGVTLAQSPDTRQLTGYSSRFFSVANGLPEQTVQAITQTADHYLWIGTSGGLVRFDGTRFTSFDRETAGVLHANSIFCLLADRDGSLWIGTEGSGLIHYQNGVFRRFDQRDGLNDLFVRTLAQDSHGRVWIGTNNGVFRLSGAETAQAVERIDGHDGIPALAVNAICEDSGGRLWLGGSRLVYLSGGRLHVVGLPGGVAQNRVKAITETAPGMIWVGTVSGLYRAAPGTESFVRVPGIQGTARGLHRTQDGQFWVNIVGQGTVTFRIGDDGQLRERTMLPLDTVLSMYEDVEKNIWLGTETGLWRFSRTPLHVVPLPHARESDFGTAYQDRKGQLWMASTHLFQMRNGAPVRVDLPQLAGVRVRNVLEDRDGSLWFGTDGAGLFHIRGSQTQHFNAAGGLINDFVRGLLQDRDGSLWIGTDEGVSHFDGTTFRNFGMKQGLAYQSVRSMLQDHNGDLWVGTEMGLSHLRHGTFVNDLPAQALRQDRVWALHEDAKQALWIGTRNNGLYRYKDGRLTHYGTADGLASDSVYDIEEDASGHFWMSGPAGISVLDRSELERDADAHTGRIPLTFFSVSADADTMQIFGGMQSAGTMTRDGDVWFPTNRGVLHVSPSRMVHQASSPLAIVSAMADGQDVTMRDGIHLAPGGERLEITYSPVMLRAQDSIRFKYKLEGLDKDWSYAGKRHVADYTNIPPGHYTFAVAAYDLSRPDVLSLASVQIVKGPHFYATWWFVTAVLLGVAVLSLAAYRARVAQLRKRFNAVLSERNRLAREVHDTLLQGCAGVSVILEAVSTLEDHDARLRASLMDTARAQVRSTINEAREAIWSLRHDEHVSQDLTTLMDRMATQLTSELGVKICMAVEGQPVQISRTTAHELMMVMREAVHNAANHADPSRVDLSVGFANHSLAIRVSDDGCGFDPEQAASGEMHFGLIGMRERVSRIGGTFRLHSMPSAGTTIAITVPLRERLEPTPTLGV